MNCRTWERLFEHYERVTLERVARAKNRFLFNQPAELDELNVQIAHALRSLREHEQQHGCR